MNVASFHVVDMNIPHTFECSSLDSATLDILFCLFRTWSFTLSTNSDASLPITKFSEFASSSSFTVSGFPDPSWIISPYLTECAFPSGRGSSRRGTTCCIISQEVFSGFPDRSSLETDFPGSWYPCKVLPWFDEVEDDTTEGILAVKFFINHDFSCDTFFSWFWLSSFCHCSRASCRTEMADVQQIQQMIPLITCETSFGRKMSANWFLVSIYVIWNLGSRLIRSNNQ